MVTQPAALTLAAAQWAKLKPWPDVMSGCAAVFSQTHGVDAVFVTGEADVQVMVVEAVPSIAVVGGLVRDCA